MKIINKSSFNAILKKYKDPIHRDHYAKYLDIRRYLPINLKYAYRLNIHKSKPLNILDVGAGAGYFCLICNYFGHNVNAMDLGTSVVFNDLTSAFGLNRRIGKIEAFKKLPEFDKKFDLITLFYVSFYPASTWSNPDEVWREGRWKFFLDDLANNLLKENGLLFIKLHNEKNGRYYNKSLLQFFLDYNITVFGNELQFRNNKNFDS